MKIQYVYKYFYTEKVLLMTTTILIHVLKNMY